MDARLVVSPATPPPRNPGPEWGFAFLTWADRWWPKAIFRPGTMLGTWVALPFMPEQRRASRDYLAVVLGRVPRVTEVWRHFYAFTDFLLLRLRVARGEPQPCRLDAGDGADFNTLIASGEPALFGTFHFGHSDLLGFFLARRGRRVAMVRMRLGNSDDTRRLGQTFRDAVRFIWVNEPAALLFALKDAVEAGESIALQCDRLEFAAKAEPFEFLGRRRLFPFTIYHLALMFGRPVMFCLGMPGERGDTIVRPCPLFRPDPAQSRAANLVAARAHFQQVLVELETLVRQQPMLWFNFLPLNPEPTPRGGAV